MRNEKNLRRCLLFTLGLMAIALLTLISWRLGAGQLRYLPLCLPPGCDQFLSVGLPLMLILLGWLLGFAGLVAFCTRVRPWRR